MSNQLSTVSEILIRSTSKMDKKRDKVISRESPYKEQIISGLKPKKTRSRIYDGSIIRKNKLNNILDESISTPRELNS